MSKTVPNPIVIEHIAIGELRPDPANPRRIGDSELEALTRSIQAFGMVDPLIVRREDRTVIGGHQRLVAARRLGLKTVPVVFVDLSVEQARLLNLALNKISGSWDHELLARLFAELNEVPDVDLSLSGFEDNEIKKLLKTLEARDKRHRTESFDLEAALESATRAPMTNRGDLWLLGQHQLLCGDSTDIQDVDRLFDGRKAAMTFADPPYNVNYGVAMKDKLRGSKRPILNDNLGDDFKEFLRNACSNMLRVTEGAVYICMSSSEIHMLRKAFLAAGGHWSTFIIWVKNTFTMGRADYQRQYEAILYGWREGANHYWCGDRDQGDVWSINRPSASELHPTMKPLELVERAIGNSSKPGDIVLDLFLGSGSTLIACERTSRVCYGMELDPHYCDVIVARWQAFTGQNAEKLPKGGR